MSTKTAVHGCTGKKRYKSAIEAIGAAIRVSAKFGRPMRHYRCPNCKAWHLTSQVR